MRRDGMFQANKDDAAVRRHRDVIQRMRELIRNKIDASSVGILEQLDKYTNKKDNTCQLSVVRRSFADCRMCWNR